MSTNENEGWWIDCTRVELATLAPAFAPKAAEHRRTPKTLRELLTRSSIR